MPVKLSVNKVVRAWTDEVNATTHATVRKKRRGFHKQGRIGMVFMRGMAGFISQADQRGREEKRIYYVYYNRTVIF